MYAECVEKRSDDLWSPVDEKDKWKPIVVGPNIAVEQWCAPRNWSRVVKVYARRERYIPFTLKREFDELVGAWKRDTAFTSSDTEAILHPAYQRIMGMGEKALPLIFKSLRDGGGNWFWALRHITGANPVSREDVGRNKRMKEVWLSWGRERNYI